MAASWQARVQDPAADAARRPRSAISDYACTEQAGLDEAESNAEEALTQGIHPPAHGPMLESRFPRWKKTSPRGASFRGGGRPRAPPNCCGPLGDEGIALRPSEAKLLEMLKQLGGSGRRISVLQTVRLRVFRVNSQS